MRYLQGNWKETAYAILQLGFGLFSKKDKPI